MEFQVTLANFEGPMDLLLHLVKETKLDIYDIPMSFIIDKYIDYIHSLQSLNIDVSSSFLVMASTLIHIKSRKLIGKVEEDDDVSDEFDIHSEEDLQNKLVMYEQYKKITSDFKDLEKKRMDIYTKVPENFKDYQSQYELVNEDNLSVNDLWQAFSEVLERLHYKEPKQTRITRKEISVASRKVWIRNFLESRDKCEFVELFESPLRENVIVTFLAILEMSKEKMVRITQDSSFGSIWVWRL